MLGGGVRRLLQSYEDYVAELTDEIEARERAERARAFAQGLQNLSDSLQQNTGRQSSSTSAPGIR